MFQNYPTGNSKNEKNVKDKLPKPVDCFNCKYKCQSLFEPEDREIICKHY